MLTGDAADLDVRHDLVVNGRQVFAQLAQTPEGPAVLVPQSAFARLFALTPAMNSFASSTSGLTLSAERTRATSFP